LTTDCNKELYIGENGHRHKVQAKNLHQSCNHVPLKTLCSVMEVDKAIEEVSKLDSHTHNKTSYFHMKH